VNATGEIHSTAHSDESHDSGLIQCINGLPALIAFPVNEALLKEGRNISTASGSMVLSKVASAAGCHNEDPIAVLAAALAEELQHWNATFPDSDTDIMVCE
jgi:hypothetical protein